MSKRELIARLLEKLSEEDLQELLGEEEPKDEEQEKAGRHVIDSTKPKRRRGKGGRKNKRNQGRAESSRPQRENKNYTRKSQMNLENRGNNFDEFIHEVSLDESERIELENAKASDTTARKNSKFRKGSRSSPLVDVRCHVCHEEDTVSAALVKSPKRYKCNDCSGSACG